MTQKQLDTLDYLDSQSSWTIEELGELSQLRALFYKTFRRFVYIEMIERASYQG